LIVFIVLLGTFLACEKKIKEKIIFLKIIFSKPGINITVLLADVVKFFK